MRQGNPHSKSEKEPELTEIRNKSEVQTMRKRFLHSKKYNLPQPGFIRAAQEIHSNSIARGRAHRDLVQ